MPLLNVLPYFNISCIVSSAIIMAVGWVCIRRGNEAVHKRLMLIGSALAVLFFVSYVAKTVLVGDTSFGGPSRWRAPYQAFLQTHSILATVAAILGIVSLYTAWKAKFSGHRRVGPWTVSIWIITAATGLAVFLLLYVIFAPGPTTNVFRAWMG